MILRRRISSLVVGLGNPGSEYERNRHNAGFMVLDQLCKAHSLALGKPKNGIGSVRFGDSLLAKPNTFMNLSGAPVGQLARYYRIPAERVLVVADCLSIEPGRIRIARNGGSAGQKGLQNVIEHLSTKEFPRIRIGIGRPRSSKAVVNFVLQNFAVSEEPAIRHSLSRAVDAIEFWLANGCDIDKTMNKYN